MVHQQLIMIVHLFLAHFIMLLYICFGLSYFLVEHFSCYKCEHITCFDACVKISVLQPMIFFNISLQLLL